MNRLKAALRVLLSGVLAWIFLTLFCMLYYNMPASQVCEDGVTEYKYPPRSFYSIATEGWGWGRINNDGYFSTFDYDGAPVEILLMGSSQTENFQVPISENIASRLNALLGRDAVYNIGVSGHQFLLCFGNLEAAVEKYRPKRIIMETSQVSFSAEALTDALENVQEEQPVSILKKFKRLRRNQYLRLLHVQIHNYRISRQNLSEPTVADERLLGELLQRLSETARNGNAEVIIFYHSTVRIAPDGAIQFPDNPDEVRMFAEGCENAGITFLDMRERFRDEYGKDYTLPYGFPNTPVGVGHFNRAGCAMVAEELYRVIEEAES